MESIVTVRKNSDFQAMLAYAMHRNMPLDTFAIMYDRNGPEAPLEALLARTAASTAKVEQTYGAAEAARIDAVAADILHRHEAPTRPRIRRTERYREDAQ